MSKFIKINNIILSTNKTSDDKYINISTIEEISRSFDGGTIITVNNYNKKPYVLSEKFEDFINRLNKIING